MDKKKLERISELTKISKERELTSEETSERQILRNEYISEIKSQVRSMLDNVEVVDGQ